MTNDNQILSNIISASGNEYSQNTIDIFLCIVDKYNHAIDEESPDEVIEALEAIEQGSGLDWLLSFDGNEYRIICDDCIRLETDDRK